MIILKKTPRFTVIMTLCLVVVTLFGTVGCNKLENYIVSFVGDGVDVEPQSIAHGNYATTPEDPEREGYSFAGWFTDNFTFGNRWDFKIDIVTQDTTLYAKWDGCYPIEIPVTEYSLAETSCQWTSFEPKKVIVINSDENLENYILCSNGTYPQIDFLKHSLLLAYGIAPSAPAEVISTQLLRTSDNEYSLHLVIESGVLGTPGPWFLSIIAPKLPQNTIITLTTIYKPIWKGNI